jgi:hypothetical protein
MSAVLSNTLDAISLTDLEKGDILDEKDVETPEHHTIGGDRTRPAPTETVHSQGPDKTESGPISQSKVDDWDGPDDPDNPYNWPNWQRWYHSAAPALLGFAVYVNHL